MKDLETNPDQHQTILFLKDGRIDLHKKTESTKEYEPLGIFDAKKRLEDVIKNPEEFINPLIKFTEFMRVVNFDETEYKDFTVQSFPNSDSLISMLKKSKKGYVIPPELAEDWISKEKINWMDCKTRKIEGGYVFNGEDMIGILYKTEEGKIIFIQMNAKIHSLVDRLFSKWTTLDKPDFKSDKS